VRNIAVLAAVTGCNARRTICEERVLAQNSAYAKYRGCVCRRLLPGVWERVTMAWQASRADVHADGGRT
jgi:hypothetical protein